MKNNSTGNKPFIIKMSLLYLCLFLSVWIGKSHESMSTVFNYISKATVVDAAPMLVQMLNKWYFITF